MIRLGLGITALLATLYASAAFITAFYADFYVASGVAIAALLAFLAIQRFSKRRPLSGRPPVDSGPWTIDRLNSELRGGFDRSRKAGR